MTGGGIDSDDLRIFLRSFTMQNYCNLNIILIKFIDISMKYVA